MEGERSLAGCTSGRTGALGALSAAAPERSGSSAGHGQAPAQPRGIPRGDWGVKPPGLDPGIAPQPGSAAASGQGDAG